MTAPPPPPARLPARYFDGHSAQSRAVTLQLRDGQLRIEGDGVHRVVPAAEVDWPERQRHGRRVAYLRDGGSVQCDDAAAWDAWALAMGRSEGWVVRAQQSWRAVAGCIAALVLLAAALQVWGIPMLARAVAAHAPWSVDESLGRAAMVLVDERLMRPSTLPAATQERIRAALARAVASSQQAYPPWQLVFRDSRIGPNALALPGGTLVMTDQLVELLDGNTDVLVAVLAHELGHVRLRHGLRAVVQVGVLAAASGLVLGDFSTLLAGAPVLLGQASYSRAAEREADAEAVQVLRSARISPAVMLQLFERLAQWRAGHAGQESSTHPWGLAFATHPADAERMRYFEEAATTR